MNQFGEFYLASLDLSPYLFWRKGHDFVFYQTPQEILDCLSLMKDRRLVLFSNHYLSPVCFIYSANRHYRTYMLSNHCLGHSEIYWSSLALYFPTRLEDLNHLTGEIF